jgi:hypothetical protein
MTHLALRLIRDALGIDLPRAIMPENLSAGSSARGGSNVSVSILKGCARACMTAALIR